MTAISTCATRSDEPGEVVHLWVAPSEAWGSMPPESLSSLSAAERVRSADFAFEDVRREFLLGRALVRLALSQFAGVPAGSWELVTDEHGKPEVAGPSCCRG